MRTVSCSGCGQFDVELIFSKILGGKVEYLLLRCSGSFDLKINDLESISGLHVEIEDVSDRQIEGASFKVFEIDQDAFSFYCRDFFAELLRGCPR